MTAIIVELPKVCDTNRQAGFNLPNVALNFRYENGYEETISSNNNTMIVAENTPDFTVYGTKAHYVNPRIYYGRLVTEYRCPQCSGCVTTLNGGVCPVCGEPLNTSVGYIGPAWALSGETHSGWKTNSQGGAVVLRREEDVCLNNRTFVDVLSGMGETINMDFEKICANTSEFNNAVSSHVAGRPITEYNGSYPSNKAYLEESCWIPNEVIETINYIRIVEGGSWYFSDTASGGTILFSTNLPVASITASTSENWLTITNTVYEQGYFGFAFSIGANGGSSGRNGNIYIGNGTIVKTIPVSQAGQSIQDAFTFSNGTTATTENVVYEYNSFVLTIISNYQGQTNVGYSVYQNTLSNHTLVTINGNQVTVDVDENTMHDPKQGYIILQQNGSGSRIRINILQSGSQVETVTVSIECAGGLAEFPEGLFVESFVNDDPDCEPYNSDNLATYYYTSIDVPVNGVVSFSRDVYDINAMQWITAGDKVIPDDYSNSFHISSVN